jgi:hypothetical protein
MAVKLMLSLFIYNIVVSQGYEEVALFKKFGQVVT